jgi:tetratricopeptide (TPR) repeat protein
MPSTTSLEKCLMSGDGFHDHSFGKKCASSSQNRFLGNSHNFHPKAGIIIIISPLLICFVKDKNNSNMQREEEFRTMTLVNAPIEVDVMQQRLHHYTQPEEQVNDVPNLNNMGIYHMESSRYDEALECFQSCVTQLEQSQTAMQYSFGCSMPVPVPSCSDNLSHHSATTTTGSDIDASISRDSYIYQRREYDEGMHVFSSPIPMEGQIMDLIDSHDAAACVVLYNLGQLSLMGHKDKEATDWFQKALFLTRRLTKSSPVSSVAILHNIGYIQYRNSELEKSLSTFNEAIQVFRRYSNKLELAATLNCLGVLYFHMPKSDTSKAMECYVRALEMRKSIFGSEHKDIATTLNNIGRVYYTKGEYDHALAKYLEALSIRRSLLGRDHLDVAATVYNAGQTVHQQGDLEQALKYYQEFMSITVPKLGQTHRDVAIMLKCMAQIYHERREYERALSLYSEALSVGRAALGMHAEVASILNKMGNLHYERGDFDSATERYKEGLAVERAVLHKHHPNICVTLTNIAQIAKQRGNFPEALKL